LSAALHRLTRQGKLFSPARGLYVAMTPPYRSWGAAPAEWFIDAMMHHLERRYYVGLLSAAAIHGAARQAPQAFQVMVDRQLRDRQSGRVRLAFHVSGILGEGAAAPVEPVTVHTGSMNVSSPALTAFDLTANPWHSGGLDNVATVLAELEGLVLAELGELAPRFPRAVTCRLGWLLEHVEVFTDLAPLRELTAPDDGVPVPLDVRGQRGGTRDRTWGTVVNTEVDADL
jgi:predicted transcriptional regulator of viral defense system